MKRTLPPEKFEQLMRLAYTDDMPPTINDDDDSGNAVHEEGMNEMLTSFFGDGNNDDNDDHMVDSNDEDEWGLATPYLSIHGGYVLFQWGALELG